MKDIFTFFFLSLDSHTRIKNFLKRDEKDEKKKKKQKKKCPLIQL